MASPRKNNAWRFLDGPISLAAVMAFSFYGVLHSEAMNGSLLHKYTTEHFVEYIIVAMLAWGIADLALRCLGFHREMRALRQTWLPQRQGLEPASQANEHFQHLQTLPEWMQESRLGKRLRQALIYVSEKHSADGFDDHLRDLSERDAGQTHANYGVPRFVVWITPVLGFLGTVVHFGLALGSLSPDDLAKNLPVVVAGMGTAFDTTTMALMSSVAIMLSMFLVERTEQGIVKGIDDWVDRELSNRFAAEDAKLAPFLHAVESTSRTTLAAMHESTSRQAETWHAQVAAIQQQQEERLQRFLAGFAAERKDHQVRLQETVDQIDNLQQHFGRLAETLAGVMTGEGELLTLQKSLADNLGILQQTQQFDQAVNGLTAAIHLLTVRQQTPSHGSKAA